MKPDLETFRSFVLGRRAVGFWMLLCFRVILSTQDLFAEDVQDKTVRVNYLVSQDRQVRPDFQQALEKAIRELQQWYGQHLNGATFRLHDPVVEVAHAAQDAKWFYSHSSGDNQDDWGFNNTLAEAYRLPPVKFNDPHYTCLIY